MSLIPFILELADELHEFNRCLATGGMDVDDFGFGIYPHELQTQQQQPHQQAQHPLPQQQQPQQQRRPRSLSQLYWLSNLSKSRHHPYYRSKTCCNKTPIHLLHDPQVDKESSHNAGSVGGGSLIGASPIGGTSAADRDTSVNSHATNANPTNTPTGKSAYSVVNKNGFQVSMNVKQFAPNELTVKTIDNCIVVEGQHEDKEDGHGVISRHFIRKYMLPKGYDPNEVLSTLSSDGILTVKAPPPPMKTDESMERIVDIQQTGGTVQVQQTSVNKTSSAKEVQVKAASAVEQPVAADTGTLQTSVTLSQQQKQQLQQLSATVENVQQQSTKQSQLTAKDLQLTHERNSNLPFNESTTEQETELQTAEQADMSSNTNVGCMNNNNNNISNDDSTTSNKNLKSDENEQKESTSVEDEEKKVVETDNVNTKTPQHPNAKTTSLTDAIMAANALAEPMETEEDEEINNTTALVDSVPATDSEDAPMTNVSNINSVSNSSINSMNSTNNNEAINLADTNGTEAATSNDDIAIDEQAKTAVPEAIDITVAPSTNNGVASELKTNITADGDTASLDTEVTEMDTVAVVVGVVAGANGEGLVDDGITVGIDMESGLDVSAIGGGNNGASVEDANDENLSETNLVVAVQSPSAGDLVAAADAAIILAKTQCDVVVAGADDVTVSKPAIVTEEMAN